MGFGEIIKMYLQGGFLMHPILILSIMAIAIIIEKYIVLKKSKSNVASFMVRIRGMLKKKDINGAISYCMEEKSPAANIIRKGLKKYKYGHARVKEAIENAGKQEITKLEKGLMVLATISGTAPLLGFLGTVTGMINAFMTIQEMEVASPSALAGGIWEALLTTAFGLGVGITAYTFYNFLLVKISKLVSDMEAISNDVVDILEEVNSGRVVEDDDTEYEL